MDFKDNVKLIDFGLGNTFITGKNLKTSCGSPCFAAPEIINGTSYNPEKVDMWSLGVTLYCMLCGQLPFDDDSKKELYKKIRSGKYYVPDFLSSISRSLLQSLINLSPDERPSAQSLMSHAFFQKVFHEPAYLKPMLDENAVVVAAHLNQLPVDALRALLINHDLGRQTTVYYLLKRKEDRGKINLDEERVKIEKEKKAEAAKHKKQEEKYRKVFDESIVDKNKKGAMLAKIRGLTSRRGTENDRSRIEVSLEGKSKKIRLDESLFNNRTERPHHIENKPILSLVPSRQGSTRMVRHTKTPTLHEIPKGIISVSLKQEQFERQSSTGSGKSYLLRRVTPKNGRGRLGESFNPSQSIEFQIGNRLNTSGGPENSRKKTVSLPKQQILFENRRLGVESPVSNRPQERSSSINMIETFKIAPKNKAFQPPTAEPRGQKAVLSKLIQAMGPRKINITIGNHRETPKDETIM